jgi:uncharacterized protein (TIGR03118 family)
MKNVWTLVGALLACAGAWAQDTATNSYTLTNLVTNQTDPHLINPWGLSRPSSASAAENEWWISDQVTGLSTLYDANGSVVSLVITIPPAGLTGTGSPTGTVFNANNFLFATLDGTISNWNANTKPTNPGTSCAKCHVTSASIMVNHSAAGAVYTALAVAKNGTSGAVTYYAANNSNSNGGVEAYDTSFNPVTLPAGAFMDSNIPSAYKPFGIQAIGAKIFVTFYNGSSGGYVDAFDTNGKLLLSLAQGAFSEPWGIAQAPAGFGGFSKTLLVGNTGSGLIAAFNPTTGALAGILKNSSGQHITIPGLWGIEFGNGNTESGPTTTLYFNGGGNYSTGVFGAIAAN